MTSLPPGEAAPASWNRGYASWNAPNSTQLDAATARFFHLTKTSRRPGASLTLSASSGS
jgi:hypothetical protein